MQDRMKNYLDSMQRLIDQHGWAIQAVMPTQRDVEASGPMPSMFYTVGLSTFSHPEFLIYGLPYDVAGGLLNDMGDRVRDGERFADGQEVTDLVANLPVTLVAVPQTYGLLTLANHFYGQDAPVAALQIVWPDPAGRWPWDDGYSMPTEMQPVPGRGLADPQQDGS